MFFARNLKKMLKYRYSLKEEKLRYNKLLAFLFTIAIPSLSFADSFLVYGGKTGWIGQKIVTLLQEQGHVAYPAASRLENREEIITEIEELNPDYIINAGGVTGVPNVDWCENHKEETIRSNIIGALNLADIAYLHGIQMTNLGTGCIYQYDEAHPMGSGIGFTEEDEPNFQGSFYSKSKTMLDKLLICYPNVLNLRLRMPIASDLHPRSFVTKITKYAKVINIPNSMSILDDLLPIVIEMTKERRTGNYNFTNPGVISHNEVLQLYKTYIDPTLTWTNFTVEEQDKILLAPRSNNELDVSKLKREFPNLPPIKESLERIFQKMQKEMNL
jgi:dTDP-4-dehydrorhamnose reductase